MSGSVALSPADLGVDSCGQRKHAGSFTTRTHTHSSKVKKCRKIWTKRGEEQIGCRGSVSHGTPHDLDEEMNMSLPRNQLILGPRSVARLCNAHTI